MSTIEEKKAKGIFNYIKEQSLKRKTAEKKHLEKYNIQLLANKQKEGDVWRELIKEAKEVKSLMNDRRYPGLVRFLDRCMAELEELLKDVALNTKTGDEMKFCMRDVAAGIRTLESIRNYPADVLNQYTNLQKSLKEKSFPS